MITSGYMVTQDANKYGGQQDSYLEEAKKNINVATKKLKQAIDDRENLVELFHATLWEMGKARHQLAVAHNTPNAELFGQNRITCRPTLMAVGTMTQLYSPYDEYNEVLLGKIQAQLRKMSHTNKKFTQSEVCIKNPPYLGRASSIEFKIINSDVNSKIAFFHDFKNCVRLSQLCGLPPPKEDSTEANLNFLNALLVDKTALAQLRSRSMEDYLHAKIHNAIYCVRIVERWKEWKKSDWVWVTVRCEIDKKLYAFSHYLTWMYRDFEHDPVEKMTGISGVTIMHQDEFLIETTLKDIASLFNKALSWNKENFQDLKEIMILMAYEFSHAMPFPRGSAAVGEWLEQTIYQLHGYQLTYDKSKLLNLEALTSTLPEFAKKYDELVKFEKM